MSSPCHLPAESWNAKPGMPVSTPQISCPRFLMASSVALFTSCARLAPAKPTMPATTAQHVINLVTCRNIMPLPWLKTSLHTSRHLRHLIRRSIVDRSGVPSLGPLRPELLAQPRRDRTGPVVAEDAAVDARGRHDAAGRRRQEDLVRIAKLRDRQRANRAGYAEIPAQLDDGEPGEALQRPAVGAHAGAIGDPED